jgi:hypothetical protein
MLKALVRTRFLLSENVRKNSIVFDYFVHARQLWVMSSAMYIYNIAFVNSERWLAKSRVDITQCQHGNVGKFLSLCFFVLYYKTNIKHFFRIDIQLYQHSRWKLGKLEIVWKHSYFSTQILVFPISTRIDITVYQHGKCFTFIKKLINNSRGKYKRNECLINVCKSDTDLSWFT